MKTSLAVVVGLVVAIPGGASGSRAADDVASEKTPVLTGRWKLDPEKSDDARAKMQDVMGEGRQGRGDNGGDSGNGGNGGQGGRGHWGGGGGGGHWGGHGGGYGGGGYHGGGGHGGNRPSEEERAAMRNVMDDVMRPADVLTVTQGDGEVTMVGDDGRTTRLFPDGRKDANGKVERKSKWDGGRLVTEIHAGTGPTVTQAWWLSPDGRQLQSSVLFQSRDGGRQVVINRLYQSAPPE